MADVLASSLSASLAVTPRVIAAPVAPPPPVEAAPEHINLNAPAYVSPSISFDPYTSIVFITYRDPETGKVRNQIPPSEVLNRYREVDQTGIPNPDLPHNTPVALAAVAEPPQAKTPDTGQGPPQSQGPTQDRGPPPGQGVSQGQGASKVG